jgi:hypothetical protein
MLFIFSTPVLIRHIRHLWQLKTVVFLHWCRKCAVPLYENSKMFNVNILQIILMLLQCPIILMMQWHWNKSFVVLLLWNKWVSLTDSYYDRVALSVKLLSLLTSSLLTDGMKDLLAYIGTYFLHMCTVMLALAWLVCQGLPYGHYIKSWHLFEARLA